MGQKQEKPLTAVLPPNKQPEKTISQEPEVKTFGQYYASETEKESFKGEKFNGHGIFKHKSGCMTITGEFVENKAIVVKRMKNIYGTFEPKQPITDPETLKKVNDLINSPSISEQDTVDLINGEGKLTCTLKEYSGKFKNGEISDGTIKYPNDIYYEGQILNFEPCGNGKITRKDFTVEGFFGGGKTSLNNGTIKYNSGDIYTGEIRWEMRIYYGEWAFLPEKIGKGTLETKDYIIQCHWLDDEIDKRWLPLTYKYKNGLVKKINLLESTLSIKLNVEDYKLDVNELSKMFLNPPKVNEQKETYELIFEGQLQGDFPKEGKLYIYKVFNFPNCKWDDKRELNCKTKLYDLKNKKIYNAEYIDGIGLFEAIKLEEPNQTSVEPEFHEEEGAPPV